MRDPTQCSRGRADDDFIKQKKKNHSFSSLCGSRRTQRCAWILLGVAVPPKAVRRRAPELPRTLQNQALELHVLFLHNQRELPRCAHSRRQTLHDRLDMDPSRSDENSADRPMPSPTATATAAAPNGASRDGRLSSTDATPRSRSRPRPRPRRSSRDAARVRVKNRRLEYLRRNPAYIESSDREFASALR